MKLLLGLFLTAFYALSLNAQSPCTDGRYANDVFNDFVKTSNITFGQNATWTGGQYTLKLDFYEPEGDTETERPLLIWVHGGSFIGGSKTDPDMVAFSERFTKKGYACASIDYRIGFFPIDSANAVKAVVRATQDLKAAIRFFYKDKQTANTYKIDTNKIFIGGSSAGAITALHVAYLDDACEIEDYLSQSTIASMGGIEGTSGNPGYSSTIQGVINGCGALARYSWMEADDVPLCSFHGTADGVVTYNRGIVNPGVPLMYLDGSRMLHERACAIGLEEYFYTYQGAGHVPYASNSGLMNLTINFIRDFLVLQLGCNETPLQPENAPSEEALLYAIDDCDGNPIIDECTLSGMAENEEKSFSIFPNPSSGLLSVNADFEFDKASVFNIQGQKLKTQVVALNGTKIDLSKFKAGSYLIQLEKSNGTVSKTLKFELIK
ncbi:MAG: T9SS type A sorting domain-containing protein [Crocinitomicaceae bacterium]|jgi:poly(3-hydroxybutyrate) depolymerase|tara:strand:+ start:13731 stop:15038 length:1308 start_codon:yes stop_codon:yes gene_type:complete